MLRRSVLLCVALVSLDASVSLGDLGLAVEPEFDDAHSPFNPE